MSERERDATDVSNAELAADFTRTIETGGEIELQVATVEWPGPERPVLVWKTFRHWKKPPTAERLAAAQQQALSSPRYFRVCRRCGKRNNVGHMHDRNICQSCAETHLGIVY